MKRKPHNMTDKPADNLIERIDRAISDLLSVDNCYPDVIESDTIQTLIDYRSCLSALHTENSELKKENEELKENSKLDNELIRHLTNEKREFMESLKCFD